MSSVFVIISETMPVNGTYPASSNDSFWATEDDAWSRLMRLSLSEGLADGGFLLGDDTSFYADHDPEKFEYIEYRIEEHTVRTGE